MDVVVVMVIGVVVMVVAAVVVVVGVVNSIGMIPPEMKLNLADCNCYATHRRKTNAVFVE